MNMFDAAIALVKAGESNAEAVAHAFVSEVQAHLEGLVSGMETRIAALEGKISGDVASGLGTLGDRVKALETNGGLIVDDVAVTAAIAALTAPTPPSAAVGTAEGTDPAVAAAASTGTDPAGAPAAGSTAGDAAQPAAPVA